MAGALMSKLAALPTLAEVAASRQGQPLPKGGSRLERAIAKKAALRDDQQQLRIWAHAVKERDGWLDRMTGAKVIGTRLQLDPSSAHAHHIVSKADWNVRTDVRNGICLSYATHSKVERNQIRIVGTKFFTVNSVRYIDATYDVKFKKVR